MLSVGERIKERRRDLGWTQDQLCSKTNLSKSFISDLENGKRSVSASNLLEIARVLSVTIDHLMTGEANNQTQSELSIPGSLAKFAADEGISMRQTLMLLDMHKQILAHRSVKQKEGLEAVDWRRFYEGVKEFL